MWNGFAALAAGPPLRREFRPELDEARVAENALAVGDS